MDKEQEKLLDALSAYMIREHLTAKEVSAMLGVSPNTITNWRKGGTMSVSNRRTVSRLVEDYSNLRITPESGTPVPLLAAQSPPPRRPSECSFDVPPPVFVPLLTVAQAATLQAAPFGPSAPSIEDGEQSGFINAKPGDFAIVVSGRSMMPWYPPGTHILVRPGKVPQTGNRVVAMIAEDIEPIFKIYINLGERFALLSINEQEGIPPRILDKMDRTEWYWCWPILESKRNEDDLDAAMKEFGIRHHWQEWLEEWQAEHP